MPTPWLLRGTFVKASSMAPFTRYWISSRKYELPKAIRSATTIPTGGSTSQSSGRRRAQAEKSSSPL